MFRDFQNYDVLEDGRIWSKVSKKFLKPQTVRGGYQIVCLVDNQGKRHQQYVHRVTWIAINGREIPEGYELNHLDENKCNNHISNLQLCTHKENVNYGTRTERAAKAMKGKINERATKTLNGKINHPQKRVGAFKNNELIMCFPSIREAGRNGFNKGNIWACCNCKFNREGNNVYKGYIWKYLDDDN